MKRIIEETGTTGLESLLGERVQLWCCNFVYAGTLYGVNDTCVELVDAHVVYQTGRLTERPPVADGRMEKLPGDVWFVQTGAIESFGVQP